MHQNQLDLPGELNSLREALCQLVQKAQEVINLLLVLFALCLDQLLRLQLYERQEQVKTRFYLLY